MPFGVYVHIPFCAARCGYCDFATWTDRAHLIDEYVTACVTDLGRWAAANALPPTSTVFFGGGTPSLLPASDLVRVLGAARSWHVVLAERFVDRGWIGNRDDYFLLHFREIAEVIQGVSG